MHGTLYHGFAVKDGDWVTFENGSDNGRIIIRKSIYALDDSPILDGCDCYTCKNHSRAYLHYLFKQNQMLYMPLACIHNVRVMQKTCELMREVIGED